MTDPTPDPLADPLAEALAAMFPGLAGLPNADRYGADLRTRLAARGLEVRPKAAPGVFFITEGSLARAFHTTGLNEVGRKPGSHGKWTGRCICNADAAAIFRVIRRASDDR